MKHLWFSLIWLLQFSCLHGQNYVLPFRYDVNSQYCLKDDLTATSLGFTSLHWYYAAKAGVYFYANDGDSLHRFDFSDLSDDYQAKAVAQNPFMIDALDSLWTAAHDTVFVWAPDLSSFSAYKASDGLTVDQLALTLDNVYVFLLQGAADTLRKWRVSTFKSGGSRIWAKDMGKTVSYFNLTASDSIVMHFTSPGSSIRDSSGNHVAFTGTGVRNGCYSYDNYKIYTPMYGIVSGGSRQEVTEFNLAGTMTGNSTNMATDTYCCAVMDTFLYVGILDNGSTGQYGIYQYSINIDWSIDQAPLGYYQLVNGKSYIFGGDATGDIHGRMLSPAVIRRNIITIDK